MARNLLKRTFLSPLLEFIHDSRAIGVIIILNTAVSLIIANSGWGTAYVQALVGEIHIPGPLHLPHSVEHWINDGLMAIFFFMVGMEIKRELMVGELASIKKSIMPVMGAIGGMLLPAGIFLTLNAGSSYANGWGVPMATDIAFSLGVASLLGSRAPVALKIFLTALAIIDDLGAILAIAVFYTSELHWAYLFAGLGIFAGLAVWTRLKLPFGIWYYVAGLVMWYFIFNSGIHATIAGVLFAFTIPLNRLSNIEHALHSYVNFLIIPIFVLANTAIIIPSGMASELATSLSLGIILGLLVGKPAGILLFCWITVRLKLGELAKGLRWKHMMGLGLLAAIGFTMSIFISMLAFKDTYTQDVSKMAVMTASLVAILSSYAWFRLFTKPSRPKKEA
ncbi:MAG: Na+/H+ antiporter NhaA [Lacibacter sp.]|jgi:NhaA family Na+:H+ antiporter